MWGLYFGRFVAGLGVGNDHVLLIAIWALPLIFSPILCIGVESVVVPVLLSEIASEETKGAITTLHQVHKKIS